MSIKVVAKSTGKVTNFMGSTNYRLNPILTLKIVSSSSLFGEPMYYIAGRNHNSYLSTFVDEDSTVPEEYRIIGELYNQPAQNSAQILERIIDRALDYDFDATLEWAHTLRKDFYIRLTPQVIMVRASIHPGRKDYTTKYPGKFAKINQLVMSRADEPASQLKYWNAIKGVKSAKGIPPILRRSWKTRLENCFPREVNKYGNSEFVDVVRVSHANNPSIDKLLRNEKVISEIELATWEQLKSEGKSWDEIIYTIKMGHMAILRNLRGMILSDISMDALEEVLNILIKTAPTGKQMPYRYYSAYKEVSNLDMSKAKVPLDEAKVEIQKEKAKHAISECLDIVVSQLPRLKGRVVALSDNSGSAYGTSVSEKSNMRINIVDNLSAMIAASRGDSGRVVIFGDYIHIFEYDPNKSIIEQTFALNELSTSDIGLRTETGIWTYLGKAILKDEHMDHLFIYSDQQAGYSKLYGTQTYLREQFIEEEFKTLCGLLEVNAEGYMHHFELIKFVNAYRTLVNPRVNISTIQTAGYDNSIFPETLYRTNVLYGWTGKEIEYHAILADIWDTIDEVRN